MHEEMALHAHSNPLPSHSPPETLTSAMGAVGNCCDKASTGDCPDAAPLYSAREFVSNFKKMLRPWRGQENTLFSLTCNSGVHHSTKE